MDVSRLTGVQVVVFSRSMIPVVLFDNPGISKCLNTLCLLHPSLNALSVIYMVPVIIHG